MLGVGQVLDREILDLGPLDLAVRHRPARSVRVGVLEDRSGVAGVAEVADVARLVEQGAQSVRHAGAQTDLRRGGHPLEDLDELRDRVVGEVDVVREAAAQARVEVDEVAHLVGVAGHDHREVVAVDLHHLDQGRDRLVAEVPAPVARERIRLVDEQDAADRLAHDLLHLERRLADVARDEVGA